MPPEGLEEARALLLEELPAGFEETADAFVAYTDAAGEAALRSRFGAVEAADVEAGWEERWKAFHRGARVGPLWIGPPWEPPPAGATSVVIDPGRAFGTGAHPTTRLCVEALEALPRGALLDVGCGSGVVAIAATLLGFDPVFAVDVDPVAVEVARANAAANGVHFEAQVADATAAALPPARVAIANIALDVVEALAPRLRCDLLVTAGYLAGDRPELTLRHIDRRSLDGWAADVWRAPAAG